MKMKKWFHPNGKRFLSRLLGGVLAGVLLTVSLCAEPVLAEGSSSAGVKLTVDYTGRSEGFAAILYDNTNGLPTAEANAILETRSGLLWIGSYSGLIRYDGNTFTRMDSTTGIASVVSLFMDSRDRLWVGTNDNGVAVLSNGSELHFNKAEGLKSASVRAITEDLDGNVYIATTHGIAVVDANMTLRTLDETQINEEYVRELKTGADGVIYGLTMAGAVFTIQNGKLTGFYEGESMGISSIHTMYPDAKNPGYLYLGSKGSEIYYGRLEDGLTDAKIITVAPLSYINGISEFQDQLWVCADNGIGIVENGICKKLENIPMTHSVENVITDYQGNLWFTSSRQGVMKIVPNQFMDVFERFELGNEVVNSTCYLDGLLYVGTDEGLIVLGKSKVINNIPLDSAKTFLDANLDQTNLVSMLKGSRIRSITRDSKDRLWFSTYGTNSLIRYDHGNVTRFSQQDGLPSDRLRTVVEREDGSVLVACTGGVAVIEGDRIAAVYNEKSGINNVEILTVAEGVNGDIVVGTDGDGIYVVHDKKTMHVGTDQGLQSGVIMRIKRDPQRKLFWIVTSNSIAYMTEDYQVTTVQKFPYPNNFDLVENSQGDIWVLSGNGLYVTPAEELIRNEEISPIFYNRDNGLSRIPTANSYSYVTENGDLYLACSSGVVKVNIEKPFENVDEIKMDVPYVEADGVMIYPNKNGGFEVPASTKKLTIYGYAYIYTLMNTQVTYWLEGFDHEKTTVGRGDFGEVSYTNLRGGAYSFVMQLRDSAGRGHAELSVRIEKQKALYEKLWFQMLCLAVIAALLAMIVFVIVRRKTKKLLKKQEENKQLIREITEAFAMTIDMKDRYTRGHSTRVADYTAMLARELGYDDETVEKFRNIALLHDIGKIGIPPEVLNKQGKLTDQEFGVIKSHSALGYEALRKITIMPELAIGARSHHERPDGKGYPQGLSGEQIPRVAQIIAVADTFDAMYSDRPYRKRMNFDKAVSIIKEVSGTQLQSDVVDAFLRLVEKGEFRDPSDNGGGSMEDINNIHKKQEQQGKADERQRGENEKTEA
ncbi:MAG: HD domain-containing protein [Lachnospiraceae bacterium]|nr:HD domain-containing protein [Lachnospiraceae bacterium]